MSPNARNVVHPFLRFCKIGADADSDQSFAAMFPSKIQFKDISKSLKYIIFFKKKFKAHKSP